jgi:hypothetical protein
MNMEDNPALLESDGDEFIAATGSESDPDAEVGPTAQAVDIDLDEDLIEADLGEFDAPLVDDELDRLDEQLLDAEEEEDEDDLELTLLQDLGIDLDAPDEGVEIDLTLNLDDDAGEDEVAA